MLPNHDDISRARCKLEAVKIVEDVQQVVVAKFCLECW